MTDRKVEVGQKDGIAPKSKVDELTSGLEYPCEVTFHSLSKKPLVIYHGKHDGVIAPGAKAVFHIHSYEQMWNVLMDVAGMAEALRVDTLGTLTTKGPAKPPAAATDPVEVK
jgi:hypothetical protein